MSISKNQQKHLVWLIAQKEVAQSEYEAMQYADKESLHYDAQYSYAAKCHDFASTALHNYIAGLVDREELVPANEV